MSRLRLLALVVVVGIFITRPTLITGLIKTMTHNGTVQRRSRLICSRYLPDNLRRITKTATPSPFMTLYFGHSKFRASP